MSIIDTIFAQIDIFINNMEKMEDIKTDEEKKKKVQTLIIAIKAMTAMRLTRDDSQPAEIIDRMFLGSIGAAFNKESLSGNGITHILTCAAKIQPRFPSVIRINNNSKIGLQIHAIAHSGHTE